MLLRVVRVRSVFAVGIIVLFILLGAGLTSVFSGETDQRAYDASNLVRLRFVANSDAPEDQAVKREVRDAVLKQSREWMSQATSGEEMQELIEAHQGDIVEDARRAIGALGRDDPVRVTWGMLPYEPDLHDPVRLPSGRYLTLQVIIGEGAGHNWWCLLFPTLCFGSEKGIEPVLPAAPEGVTLQDDSAATKASSGDRAPSSVEPKVRTKTDEELPQTGPSIHWAIAGFSSTVQASEGPPGESSGGSDEGTGDVGRASGDFELHAGLYKAEDSLDRVRFRLGLFR